MVKHLFLLGAALTWALLSLIAGASDNPRKKDFPGGSIILAVQSGFMLFVALA